MWPRTLKMAFWLGYDHLGKLVVSNVLAMAVWFPMALVAYGFGRSGFMLGAGVAVVVAVVVWMVAAAGMAFMIKEWIDTRDGSLRGFFTGIRHFGKRAAALALLYCALAFVLLLNVWFYASRVGPSVPWLGYGMSALALWALAALALTAVLAVPALVQKQAGVWPTLKLTVLLVLDNPLFCVLLALHLVTMVAACAAPPVLVFFSLGPQVALASAGYEMLARKYAALEAQRVAQAEGRRARTWPECLAAMDAGDDYLCRGFQDLLFPWKG